MPKLPSRGILRTTLVAAFLVGGTIACAETMSAGIEDKSNDAGTTPPSFTPPPDEAGAATEVGVPDTLKLCIATECPAPYATCGFSADRCRINLSNDLDNCGACGNKCPSELYSTIGGDVDVRHLAPACVNGECTVVCNSNEWADCNGRVDDGCETSLKGNPEACGGCGIKCAPGEPCVKLTTGQSKCGCPAGQTWCPATAECVNLQFNDDNCGVCGTKCPAGPADGGAPLPPHTKYGCMGGTCGTDESHIKCDTRFGAWSDCNGDLPSPTGDGCELNVNAFTTTTVNDLPMYLGDPKNCGACGNACPDGQTCALLRQGGLQCACPSGTTLCQSRRATWCADLLTSPSDCGACGNSCANDLANNLATAKNLQGLCKKGVCVNECTPGWGDCDGDLTNGCETNLKTNIAHCGVCGNRCDTAAGQPCIDGMCLMTECDGGTDPTK